jgi:hypothetical protein
MGNPGPGFGSQCGTRAGLSQAVAKRTITVETAILSSNRHKSQVVTVLFRTRLAILDIFTHSNIDHRLADNVDILRDIGGRSM